MLTVAAVLIGQGLYLPGAAPPSFAQVIRWQSQHRWTTVCLLVYNYLVAVARQHQQDASSD